MALPLGKRTSEPGSLQPGVTETKLCPISGGVGFGEPAASEKDCLNLRFSGGRFSSSKASERTADFFEVAGGPFRGLLRRGLRRGMKTKIFALGFAFSSVNFVFGRF